jgi:hypothetical protein
MQRFQFFLEKYRNKTSTIAYKRDEGRGIHNIITV